MGGVSGGWVPPVLAHLYYNSSLKFSQVSVCAAWGKVCLAMSSNAFSNSFCKRDGSLKLFKIIFYN